MTIAIQVKLLQWYFHMMLLFFTTLQINIVWKFHDVLIFKSRRVYRTFKIIGMFQKRFANMENA